jgi:hypothetical protein
MKATEALAKLKQSINIKYYVGPAAAEAITKACEAADKPATKKAPVKKADK